MKTMLFNPYTGKPRDPRDIASDPEGTLMLDPDEPMRAAVAQPVADERGLMHAAWAKHTGEEWHFGAGLTRNIWEAAWQARAALCQPAEEGGKVE